MTRLLLVAAVLVAVLACAGAAAGATTWFVHSDSEKIGSGEVGVEVTESSIPEEEWNVTFGGIDEDRASSVQQTTDGGYIVAGGTMSYGDSDGDFWLVKTESDGRGVWNKTFGGTGRDWASSVQQTTDGGYILAGGTRSYGAGYEDFWLVKADSNGNEQWNKTFGGAVSDFAFSVQQTTDGGYIVAGGTMSYGAGWGDIWLVKTDSNGNEQWNKTFGGTEWDRTFSVQQTSEGGYIFVGYTESYGAGWSDVWLVKTDSNGNEQWNKTFGGTKWDEAASVQQTTDGGYIIAGHTTSGAFSTDFWIVKTDSNGNKEWGKTFGGTDYDFAASVQQTSDGGYIVAGHTESYGAGSIDFYLVKTDPNGNEQWNKTFGGTKWDEAASVQQTSDGGYIIAGWTRSYGSGSWDFWLIKLCVYTTRGDLNHDGILTPADAAIALAFAAGGSASCDPAMLAAADVSGDGCITSLDALMILQAAGGAINI